MFNYTLPMKRAKVTVHE